MDLINYFLIILISFLGLGSGIALAYIAKEELEKGKRYFIIMQLILMVLIIVSAFLNGLLMLSSFIFLFGFPSGSLIMYEKFRANKISKKTYILYSSVYMSFIIFISVLYLW
jgi:hypothetical protein